ncbi:hypothetical protein DL93DRAFT_1750802 [Clavulina sp. PMI_390]|nr:hypothetical protein DL93DRAFT_1750802 [Clavulina sp. PMI_390]
MIRPGLAVSRIRPVVVSSSLRVPLMASRAFRPALAVEKKKKSSDDDDAFGGFEDDDLFGSSSSGSTSTPSNSSTASPSLSALESTPSRNQRSPELLAPVLASYMKACTSKDHLPRKHAIRDLLTYISYDQAGEIPNAIAAWRASPHTPRIDAQTANEVVGRLVNLGRPELALSMLANRPKYGLDLDQPVNKPIVQSLLLALCQRASKHARVSLAANEGGEAAGTIEAVAEAERVPGLTAFPATDVLLFAALYPQFRMGEIYDEPLSLALLLGWLNSLHQAELTSEIIQFQRDVVEFAGSRKASAAGTSGVKKGKTVPVVTVAGRMKLAKWVQQGRASVPYAVIWK